MTSGNELQFDAFVSYSHKDKTAITTLINRLRFDGFRLWVDEEQIGGGDPLRRAMVDGISQSQHVIVCLSPAYLESKWATFESAVNQALDPDNQQRRLIPVKVAPVAIPAEYGWLYCPDLTNPDIWEQEYLKTIKHLLLLRPLIVEALERDNAPSVDAPSTEELIDQTVKSATPDPWLQNRFYYDPFAFFDAEELSSKMEIIDQIFVNPDLDFDRYIINPNRSTVLMAPQGSGKTAGRLRLMLHLKRHRQNPTDRPLYTPLVVVFSNFERIIECFPNVKLSDHKASLLTAIAEAVYSFITDSQDQFLALDYKVRKWWWAFLENHLEGEMLDFRLQEYPSLITDWQKVAEQPSPFGPNSTLDSILKSLRKPLNRLGFDTLFILVDGVDGYIQALPNMEALVAPLLNSLPLLSLAEVRWKFFFPSLLQKTIEGSAGWQKGRLDIISINWDEKQLENLLRLRLEWASTFPDEIVPRVHSLSELCDEVLFNKINLDHELVQMALQHKRLGPPRALLDLGSKLLRKLAGKTVLSLEDWNNFIASAEVVTDIDKNVILAPESPSASLADRNQGHEQIDKLQNSFLFTLNPILLASCVGIFLTLILRIFLPIAEPVLVIIGMVFGVLVFLFPNILLIPKMPWFQTLRMTLLMMILIMIQGGIILYLLFLPDSKTLRITTLITRNANSNCDAYCTVIIERQNVQLIRGQLLGVYGPQARLTEGAWSEAPIAIVRVLGTEEKIAFAQVIMVHESSANDSSKQLMSGLKVFSNFEFLTDFLVPAFGDGYVYKGNSVYFKPGTEAKVGDSLVTLEAQTQGQRIIDHIVGDTVLQITALGQEGISAQTEVVSGPTPAPGDIIQIRH